MRFARILRRKLRVVIFLEVLEVGQGMPQLSSFGKLFHFLLLWWLLLRGDENCWYFNGFQNQNLLKFCLLHFESLLFFQIGWFSRLLELLSFLFLRVCYFCVVHFFVLIHYYLIIKTFTLVMLPYSLKNLHLLIELNLNQLSLQFQTHHDYHNFLAYHHHLHHKLPSMLKFFFHKPSLLLIILKISIRNY